MSLNDKSKKELADMAKELKLKTNAKMDKKALINLIEQHNKQNSTDSIKEEIKQKAVMETILNPKEERITQQDLKDIQEARSEMTDQASDEAIEEVVLTNNSEDMSNTNTNQSSNKVQNSNKSSDDEYLYSEGYTGRSSYKMS